MVRAVLILTLVAHAFGAPLITASDDHQDLFDTPDFEEEGQDMGDEAEIEFSHPPVSYPIVISKPPTKPDVPPIFAEASVTIREWLGPALAQEQTAVAKTPARQPASSTEFTQTKQMTDAAMEKEKKFQRTVKEGTLVPETYQRILSALSGDPAIRRPIEDAKP